jgi:hypothetical protein
MSIETNGGGDTVGRFYQEVFSDGDLDVVDELVSTGHVLRIPSLARDDVGPDAVKRFVALPRTVAPDIKITIERQITEGETVVIIWTAKGTLAEELRIAEETDDFAVEASGVTIHRLVGERFTETSWRFEASARRFQGSLREEYREIMSRGILGEPDGEDALPICCLWTGCRCSR